MSESQLGLRPAASRSGQSWVGAFGSEAPLPAGARALPGSALLFTAPPLRRSGVRLASGLRATLIGSETWTRAFAALVHGEPARARAE